MVTSRLLCRRLAAGVILSLGLGVAASPAQASFPGRNGSLLLSIDSCYFAPHLRAFTPGGRDLGPLTVPCEVVAVGPEGDETVRAASSPDWSPDGSRVVFEQTGAEPEGLVSIAADGSDPRPIPGTAGATAPSFAPDGRHVAFEQGGSIWTIALDGSDRRLLRASVACPPEVGNCRVLAEPRWSPDGRRIAVTAVEESSYAPAGAANTTSGIWLMHARTGRLIREVVRLRRRLEIARLDVDWSPDARRLLFRSQYTQEEVRGGASGGNIWVVRADGKGLRRLVHRRRLAETVPRWSPDGRWIAWIGLRFGVGDVGFGLRPTLWRMKSTGGHPRRVRTLWRLKVEEGFYDEPDLTWQPLR